MGRHAQPPPHGEGPKAAPRRRDPRRLIHVYDPRTGTKNRWPVPETWLDIFPHLRETPSTRKKD